MVHACKTDTPSHSFQPVRREYLLTLCLREILSMAYNIRLMNVPLCQCSVLDNLWQCVHQLASGVCSGRI